MWVEEFAVLEKFRVDLDGGEMVGMSVLWLALETTRCAGFEVKAALFSSGVFT